MTLIMPNQLRPGQYNDQITTVAMEITNDFQTIPEDIPFMVWIMVNNLWINSNAFAVIEM